MLKEGAVFGMIWNIDDCEAVLSPWGGLDQTPFLRSKVALN